MTIKTAVSKMPGDLPSFPMDRYPNNHTEYIRSTRLTMIGINPEGKQSNKEYVLRIYRYTDGKHSLIGWSGAIGGTLSIHPKYFGADKNPAFYIFDEIVAFLTGFKKGYKVVADNKRAPGKDATSPAAQSTSAPTPPNVVIEPKKVVAPSPQQPAKAKEKIETPEPSYDIPESDMELLGSRRNWYKIAKSHM